MNINKKSYEYIYSTFIDISSIERNGLLESFFIPINNELNNLKNKEDLCLIIISSFFYCILHKMKDDKNYNINNNININNSRITKFLSNIIDNLIIYLKNCKYNINFLVNELFIYANEKEKKTICNINNSLTSSMSDTSVDICQTENIDYDFKMIDETIMGSGDNNLKERFQQVKKKFKIEPFDFPTTVVGTLFRRIVDVFTSNIYYYANYIRLSPFQKYMSSNVVTIFVSGFGSQNDIHRLKWKKYIENDKQNSTYYFYHWPSGSFSKIFIKSLPLDIKGIKMDSDLPKAFIDSKNKAKCTGKLLSIILSSKLFFGYRQINLVAFSLGNHVIKNCLKELSNRDDGKMVINNVTFLAGATTFRDRLKWYNIFNKVVGGRIVNCYSKVDYILKYLYSNCTGNHPIGNNYIDINDGKGGKNIIENYDLTDLNIGHLDYRKKFSDILKRINK